MRAPFSMKHASGDQREKPPTFRRLMENFALLPHRAEAHTTVLSKSVGQRLRACPDAECNSTRSHSPKKWPESSVK
jgi:hypothetical protein